LVEGRLLEGEFRDMPFEEPSSEFYFLWQFVLPGSFCQEQLGRHAHPSSNHGCNPLAQFRPQQSRVAAALRLRNLDQ
jgi:hypothetical protein